MKPGENKKKVRELSKAREPAIEKKEAEKKKQAEVKRQAETNKQAEAEKKFEADKKPEAQKKPDTGRKVEAQKQADPAEHAKPREQPQSKQTNPKRADAKKEHKHISKLIDAFFLLSLSKPLFFLMLIFDILFIVALIFYNKAMGFLLPLVPFLNSYEMQGVPGLAWFSVAVLLIYCSIALLIYSFFKYCMLHLVRGYFKKENFTLSSFLRFYVANLLIFLVLLLYYMLVSMFAFTFMKSEALIALFGAIVLIPVAYFAIPYIWFVQVSVHSHGKNIRSSLKAGFSLLKSKIAGYSALYLADLLIVLAYSLFFIMLTEVLNLVLFKNDTMSASYQVYQAIFIGLAFFFLWLLMVYNRVYLYSLCEAK